MAKRAYTYTLNGPKDGGQRKTMTTDTGAVTTYIYDKLNRLTSATVGTITDSWTYDANSNRLTEAKTGTATVYTTFNAADQLCWHGTTPGTCAAPPSGAVMYGYDANGNTTLAGSTGTTQAYNVFNQFITNTSGSTVTNYTYAGVRNDERITAGSTSFLNGSLGVTQQTKSGGTTSFIRDPDGTLISMRDSAGASYYYTTDALGSVILLTDSNQAKAATYGYDSWGQATSTTGAQAATNPWTYAGGYNDTTSNRIKFGARYYNPARGRFTQPDPSGKEANRYAYVKCNPVNATDPTGLDSSGECIGAAAGILVPTVSFLWFAGSILGAVYTGGALVPLAFEMGVSFFGIIGAGMRANTYCN